VDVGEAALEGGLGGVSTMSDVAVVLSLIFGCVDGEEHASRDPVVGSASTKVAPRTCS
jgi:hypothetical protein